MITRVSRDDPSFGRWLESGPKPGAEQGRPKTWRPLLVRSRRHGVNDIDLLPNLSSRRDKHHRRPTASSGDDGIVLAGIRSYPVAEPPKMAGICIRGASRWTSRQTRQNAQAWPPHRNRDASMRRRKSHDEDL